MGNQPANTDLTSLQGAGTPGREAGTRSEMCESASASFGLRSKFENYVRAGAERHLSAGRGGVLPYELQILIKTKRQTRFKIQFADIVDHFLTLLALKIYLK